MQLVIETKKARIEKIHQLARLLNDASDIGGIILILRTFLGVNPSVFDVRYLMRRLQILQYNRGSSLSFVGHSFAKMKVPLQIAKAKEFIEKEPYKALEVAEDILANDPFDENGNRLVVDIAKSQQNYRLMIMAYETICVRKPNDPECLNELGKAYLLDQRYVEAREVFHQLLNLMPNHPEATAGLAKIGEMTGMAAKWIGETAHFTPPATIERRGGSFNIPDPANRPVKEMSVDEVIIVDPVKSQGEILDRLERAFELVENHAFHDLSKFDEWQNGVEDREKERIHHLEQLVRSQPQNADANFRLGVINMERFHLADARTRLEVSASDPNLEFISYALIALCFLHESIVSKPTDGPSREDFAWFI